jgi:hypothetical protein
LRIQRTHRRASTPKARRKKTCRARPRPRYCPSTTICSALKDRHPLSGPSRRLGRSNRTCILGVAQRLRRPGGCAPERRHAVARGRRARITAILIMNGRLDRIVPGCRGAPRGQGSGRVRDHQGQQPRGQQRALPLAPVRRRLDGGAVAGSRVAHVNVDLLTAGSAVISANRPKVVPGHFYIHDAGWRSIGWSRWKRPMLLVVWAFAQSKHSAG